MLTRDENVSLCARTPSLLEDPGFGSLNQIRSKLEEEEDSDEIYYLYYYILNIH
jgi:hypothetical protein